MTRTAFVTGASSGFGRAIARMLLGDDWQVIATGRRRERLDALQTEFGDACAVACFDIRDADAIKSAVDALPERFKHIDLLVNNAGLALGTAPAPQADLQQWRQMIDTNITGLVTLTHAVLPRLIAAKGLIVNISSIAATYPYSGGNVYGGSKAYVTAFTQALNQELAGKGVQVQAVLPGATATDFWQIGGLPLENLDPDIVMSAEDLVDGALQDFDNGVLISLPSLHDLQAFDHLEASRQALFGQLSSNQLAQRYSAR